MKLRRDVRDWVVKAEEDCETARLLVRKRKPNLSNAVCFHAQQCAEKYLKAFLIFHRIAFLKTHDLLDLLELAKRADPTLELLRPDLAQLEPYAVEYRYPGEFATRHEAKRSARVMAHLRLALQDRLGSSRSSGSLRGFVKGMKVGTVREKKDRL